MGCSAALTHRSLGDSHRGIRPSWIDLIQESIQKDQFEKCDDYKCRRAFGGNTVEMSKTDCDALSSELLRKLLQAAPEPEDVQARSQLIQDLTYLQEDISESEGDNFAPPKYLHALTINS